MGGSRRILVMLGGICGHLVLQVGARRLLEVGCRDLLLTRSKKLQVLAGVSGVLLGLATRRLLEMCSRGQLLLRAWRGLLDRGGTGSCSLLGCCGGCCLLCQRGGCCLLCQRGGCCLLG